MRRAASIFQRMGAGANQGVGHFGAGGLDGELNLL